MNWLCLNEVRVSLRFQSRSARSGVCMKADGPQRWNWESLTFKKTVHKIQSISLSLNYRVQTGNTNLRLRSSSSLSADDEDSRSFLSHRRKTLYHHVVHQSVFILFFIPPSSFSSISFCSSICRNLLSKPLPLHRLRQLIGQLPHRHLQTWRGVFTCFTSLCLTHDSTRDSGDQIW